MDQFGYSHRMYFGMLRVVHLVLLFVASGVTKRVVQTQYGQVRSHVVNVDNGREKTSVDVWYGIPFAGDTSGQNRFRSPVPPEPWTDILEANTQPPVCPQGGVPDFRVSEDCLKLNVYTPTNTSEVYPVMVWIYGGAYQTGANNWYPGHFLASRGIILVTLNYRLNKFGFSYTGNDACPGNAGMWDQVMGLQWVVDNIANFSGDPNKITVFGESAGGTSTGLHVVSPISNKLFQQAIMESGAEQSPWAINPPDAEPTRFTYTVAENVGCDVGDDYAMMDCMRNLPWQTVESASIGRCSPGFICNGMGPVVDGPGGFLPQHPGQQRLDGDVMQGPILAGICKEDGSLFTSFIAPAIGLDDCCNRTYFEHCLQNNLVDFFSVRMSNSTADEVYAALNWFYSPWPHIYDTDENRLSLVEIVTDISYGTPWDKQLKEQQAIAPTFGYVYDYLSNRSNSEEWLGTYHAAEIDMVFGFPQLIYNPDVREDSGIDGSVPTEQDIEFTIFVQELWTNFAKYGNPTPNPMENPINGGSVQWPQYTAGDMNYLYMGDHNIESRKEYRQKVYAFWTFYLMGIAGDEMGISDYWDVYDPYSQGVDPEEILESWMRHRPTGYYDSLN